MLLGNAAVTLAAEIDVKPATTAAPAVIFISGEIVSGDDQKFIAKVLPLDRAAIILNSPGGDVVAAIGIGKAIRLKEFPTYVPKDWQCLSACGLIWLGGIQRFMDTESRVGFHAVYVVENGSPREIGQGNALVGAYLNQIGLGQSAIAYVTSAAPSDMKFLTPENARSVGIEVSVIEAKTAAPIPAPSIPEVPTAEPPPQKLVVKPRPSPTPHPDEGFVVIPGADIFGFDLPGMPLKDLDLNSCRKACEERAECLAYTFNKGTVRCYLKGGGGTVVGNAKTDTGFRPTIAQRLRRSEITVVERTDMPGNDIRDISGITFDGCISACEAEQECKAFTYARRAKQCWLKSVAGKGVPSKFTTSGFRRYPWEGIWSGTNEGCNPNSENDGNTFEISRSTVVGFDLYCTVDSVIGGSHSGKLELSCMGDDQEFKQTLSYDMGISVLTITWRSSQPTNLLRCPEIPR